MKLHYTYIVKYCVCTIVFATYIYTACVFLDFNTFMEWVSLLNLWTMESTSNTNANTLICTQEAIVLYGW